MVRGGWVAVVAMALGLGASGAALGQVTRVATFENFVEGKVFPWSFTDPVSGITFRDPTSGANGFIIEYSTSEFGGGNYLESGALAVGPSPSWSGGFGFSADLPAPANRVSFDITYNGGRLTSVLLTAYNSSNAVVAQEQGPESAPLNFRFEVTSPQYDITHFTVTATNGIFTGYDNVSYTVLPEPVWVVGVLVGMGVVLGGRRGTRPARGAAKRGRGKVLPKSAG